MLPDLKLAKETEHIHIHFTQMTTHLSKVQEYTQGNIHSILLLNDDNILGRLKGREKNILYFDRGKSWI